MGGEKQYTEGISTKNNKFLAWFDNYWYHYKWVTIIVAFAIIVFSICIIQSCTNKKTDILITYAGPVYIQSDQGIAMENSLDKAINVGVEEKEKLGIGFASYYVLTAEQIGELQKQTDSDGYQIYVDTAFNSQEMDSLEAQLMAGSSSIIFIDKDMYKMFFKENGSTERLHTLKDVLGETPANAADAYAVRLGDTEIYKNTPELQKLPEDTLVCLHKKLGQKDYERQIDTFKKVTQIAKDGGQG